jgi:hypothetical protein
MPYGDDARFPSKSSIAEAADPTDADMYPVLVGAWL